MFYVCADIQIDNVEFYYIDVNSLSNRDIVLIKCKNLIDVNNFIDNLNSLKYSTQCNYRNEDGDRYGD